MSHDDPDPRSTRIRVVRGGTPSAEELAALVIALTPTAAPLGDDGRPDPPAPVPAWARAALLEGVGMLAPVRPSDLVRAAVLG